MSAHQPNHKRIFDAIEKDNVAELQEYLLHPETVINAVDSEGFSLLHKAAQLGRLECLKLLLVHPQINVNINGADGRTPLFCAIENGSYDCIQTLLSHQDIEVNITNEEGITPVEYAINNNKFECLKALLAHKQKYEPVKDRYSQTGTNLNDFQREQKVNQYSSSTSSNSILSSTTSSTLQNTSTPIIDSTQAQPVKNSSITNASLSQKDENGATQLHRAARLGDTATLRSLLQSRLIDVNAQDAQGNTA